MMEISPANIKEQSRSDPDQELEIQRQILDQLVPLEDLVYLPPIEDHYLHHH